METARSGGAGGQNVNKARGDQGAPHPPAHGHRGDVPDRAQPAGNRMKAMQMLRSKLYEQQVLEQERRPASAAAR
ncbi:MAG: peptide chain release factor-like protein [Flavobacteriales bacterium]